MILFYKLNQRLFISSVMMSLRQNLNQIINILLPPRCPITGDVVERVGAISPTAWKNLTFISDPICTCCGIPFSIDMGTDEAIDASLLCGECLTHQPSFHSARSSVLYDDFSKPMILSFKHGDALHLHTSLAPLLANLIPQDLRNENSVIVPVPLHWTRLVKRRYNQSAVLAQSISDITGIVYCPDILLRTRSTPPQGHQSAKDRQKNVAGAFAINPKYQNNYTRKNFILVDDVYTTGATLNECAKTLQSSYDGHIHVVTLARAVKK
jgi:ComF family protein